MVAAPRPGRPLRIGMVICSEYEANPRVRRQAEALAARGDEVTVLALHAEGRPREDLVDGVRVVHTPTRKYRGDSTVSYLSLYGGFIAHASAWLLRQPRTFDLVQAHTMPEAVAFAATLQRLLGVPVLLDVHDLTERLFASKFRDGGPVLAAVRASTRLALRFATEVLTVHEPYAAIIRQWTRRPVSVVLNSPDARLFPPRPFRPWPPGEVVFSYHGLIAPRHGLVNAVEALAKLRLEVPGARMQVLGSGDGLPQLRARVQELGLTDAVSLPTTLLPITEMPAFLERAHIGVVPSQRDPWTDEVLPTKLLEYAVSGIPVITFRNPVIERYFPEDAVTYVDPASPENLLVAMRTLVADPELARRQAQRASEVVAGMSWDQQKLAYFEVIDRMVARRARRGWRAGDRDAV
ncbi:MAG: glycosyltransferase [Micromonosporaceae bacterium]|nr:glycosyltransferase [Micromonosporaceae bacterium]